MTEVLIATSVLMAIFLFGVGWVLGYANAEKIIDLIQRLRRR